MPSHSAAGAGSSALRTLSLEGGGSQGKKTRGQGPLAVVRLYDTLLSNVKDLTETAGQLGGTAGEYLLDECNAKVRSPSWWRPCINPCKAVH